MQASIAEVAANLSSLVDRVQTGELVVILREGRPIAKLMPFSPRSKVWRANPPDDPKDYAGIDLDAPILDEI